MLLQYAFNGLWIIPLGTYLNAPGYTGVQIGSVYGAFAIAGIVPPFIIGLLADRNFAAHKMLGGLKLVASGLLLWAAQSAANEKGNPAFTRFCVLVLLHFLCYMPTWSLTNGQVTDTKKQFTATAAQECGLSPNRATKFD